MEVVDDYTFRINIKKYTSTWLQQLSGEQSTTTGLIVSPTAVKEHGEEWALWNPVGTGPFKFKEYIVDTSFTMDRFDDYWGDKALVDQLKWIFIADYVTATMNFEAGKADVMRQMGMATDMQRDLLPKGYLADPFLGLTNMLVPSSNNPGSVLSSKEVREAIEYAIDKETITASVFYGFSEPRYQLASHNMVAYLPDFQGRRYDPEKARQLLNDAGYPNGIETTLYAPFMFAGDAVTAMQASLEEAGIHAKIETLDVPRWLDMSRNGWDDGLNYSVYGGASFGTFVSSTWGPESRNEGYWDTVYLPDEIAAMEKQWLILDDEEEMVTLGQQILQKMHDEAIAIPLWQGDDVYMLQPYVRDLHLGDETFMFFDTNHVWLDK
jgi:peptide/nickel transport system substrate-binding protein